MLSVFICRKQSSLPVQDGGACFFMLHNSSVGRSWEQPGQLSAGSSGGDACECPGGRASIGPPALLTGGAGRNRAAVPVLGVHGDARSGGARGSDAHVAVLLVDTMGLGFGDASGCFQRGRDLRDNLWTLHVLSIIRNPPSAPKDFLWPRTLLLQTQASAAAPGGS